MATTSSHNKKSSSVKRILSEARELSSDTSSEYTAAPLEDNIFEWHFTLRGPSGSEFADGLYHGRILLPAEYPMRPPNLMILTPNGRWELNKKICLTFTGFHEEMWQPAWGIRTALLGIQTFMTARAEAAAGIGALDYSVEVRERLAKESRKWTCPTCQQSNVELLPDPDPTQGPRKVEALPDGLTIDPSRKAKISPADGQGTAEGSGSDQPVPAAVAPALAVAGRDPISATASETTALPEAAAGVASAVAPAPPTPPQQNGDRTALDSAAVPPPPAVQQSIPTPTPTRSHSAPDHARPRRGTAAAAAQRPTAAPGQHAPLPSLSSDERTLALLDRCIALLVGLVALLVIKRLI